MKTLTSFSDANVAIPASTSWYLDTLGEFRGKQELYTRQSPQKLKVLREHAMIESAGAKAELVRSAVRKYRGEFRLSDIERACPGV